MLWWQLGIKNPSTKHGKSGDRTYRIWAGIQQRCLNPNNSGYANYGGRGIRVCDRWKVFDNFLADMGEAPAGTSIDRIDNDGPYEPANCRWATRTDQNRNSRHNVMLTIHGRTQTMAEWGREAGIKPPTLSMRVKAGWPSDQLLRQPKVSRR
jgi:hypothetical protein